MQRIAYLLSILGLLLAACAPATNGGELPTVARLEDLVPPTATTSPDEATRIALPPTLPPTFTPTPSETPTSAPTETPTITVTPSATITDTPSPTATELPTIAPEERPLAGLLEAALRATVLPPELLPPPGAAPTSTVFLPPPVPPGATSSVLVPTSPAQAGTQCSFLPPGGFGTIFVTNPDLARGLGCPVGAPPDVLLLNSAWQPFQNGLMVWVEGRGIYVFYNLTSAFQRYDDTFQEGIDPFDSGETPPAGLIAPVRGFNKVWSNFSNVRAGLGWGTAPETGTPATVMVFQNGLMIWLQNRGDVLVLIGTNNLNGSWRSVVGRF